jgi:hypothetical protein
MTNPYQSPLTHKFGNLQADALRQVSGPAWGLMIVSAVCVGLLALSAFFDLFVLLFVPLPEEPGDIDPQFQAIVRLVWGICMLLASCASFYGGLCLKRLRNYPAARAGAIVACVPCLGPCCLLGIPFGIWALTTLSDADVKAAFTDD